MPLTLQQLAFELDKIQSQRDLLREEGYKILDAWVREEVDRCRTRQNTITRESIELSEGMGIELQQTLCRAIDINASTLTSRANDVLHRLPAIPSSVKFELAMLGYGIRLIFKH